MNSVKATFIGHTVDWIQCDVYDHTRALMVVEILRHEVVGTVVLYGWDAYG